jgi:hypothetical protein
MNPDLFRSYFMGSLSRNSGIDSNGNVDMQGYNTNDPFVTPPGGAIGSWHPPTPHPGSAVPPPETPPPPPADPGLAACVAAGIGTICSDGTIYAGVIDNHHIFIPQQDEVGVYTWDKGEHPDDNGSDNYVTGATDVNSGLINYPKLANATDIASPYEAEKACKKLNKTSYLSYTDWYLPAKNELVLICQVIKNPDIDYAAYSKSYRSYWSSTETNFTMAKTVLVSTCNVYNNDKHYHSYKVRCARRD